MLTSCVSCAETIDANPISRVDEIRVVTNHDKEILRTIDPEIVKSVKDLVNTYLEGWSKPWYGAPIAKQKIKFYYQGEFVTGFGLGSSFFTRGNMGFNSRSASDNELYAFREILNIPNPYK